MQNMLIESLSCIEQVHNLDFFSPFLEGSIMEFTEYIKTLLHNNGPESEQYLELNSWFQAIGKLARLGIITQDDVGKLRQIFGDAFGEHTMQGFSWLKPHGYAGDYEIIDRIYTYWLSPKDHLVKWDKFFHWQKAPEAVRNRKIYFKGLLASIESCAHDKVRVLDIGSGPCRDIFEYLQENPSSRIHFDCVDMDRQAVTYAQRLLNREIVKFHCRNAFRFRSQKKYHLVWSAGLFDYLNDSQFVFLFRSLFRMVAPGGELVIGNFSENNPSRGYMEFGEWFLNHRNENKLFNLALRAGCSNDLITVEMEPLGVNLFLRVRRP